jgi:hypothetical protein
MTTTAVKDPHTDLDALESDAREQIESLNQQRQRIAPEALKDENVAAELRGLAGELAAAERTLDQVALARLENERRDQEAERDAEARRKAKALQRARELQNEREMAARRVDRGAKQLAVALHDLDAICESQRIDLMEAGEARDSVRVLPLPSSIESAIAFAMREANAPRGIINLPGAPVGREMPLAKTDIKPVQPAPKSTSNNS